MSPFLIIVDERIIKSIQLNNLFDGIKFTKRKKNNMTSLASHTHQQKNSAHPHLIY